MKKAALLIALALATLAAGVEEQIYGLIIQAIFPKKSIVRVWVDDTKKRELFSHIGRVIVVPEAEQADALFLFHEHKALRHCKNCIVFVGSYPLLLKTQNEAIGGFFWQKGRPNIIFLRKNLQAHNIQLPSDFSKYIEDRP